MNEILRPGSGLLFMKVGTHAHETLADIIARKDREIRQTGYGMWGYGGNTCHPTSMVQPFAQAFEARGETIHLCMEQMDSKHFADPICADEYSADGLEWHRIPETIRVLGSRFALVIENLRHEEFALPLDRTRVPVGNSTGRIGSRYVKGRVDKACLEVTDRAELANDEKPREPLPISLVAELRAPYAVFLRGERE